MGAPGTAPLEAWRRSPLSEMGSELQPLDGVDFTQRRSVSRNMYFSNVNTDTNILFIKNNVFLPHCLPFLTSCLLQ